MRTHDVRRKKSKKTLVSRRRGRGVEDMNEAVARATCPCRLHRQRGQQTEEKKREETRRKGKRGE